jgi:hypothetical protein
MRRRHCRAAALGVLPLAALSAAGCSAIRTGAASVDEAVGFDPSSYEGALRDDLELAIGAREVVEGGGGRAALRVRYSFVSYRGYPAEADVRRSSATLFLPLGADGAPRPSAGRDVFVVEYPPGASRSVFDLMGELGLAPATRLDVASAVVDVRGPVVRDLAGFENPDAGDRSGFAGEEQFAYAMLRSYAETGDLSLLWEQRVGESWLRAVRATEAVLAREVPAGSSRFVLAAEGRGAVGAAQAAAVDEGVGGLVLCGWPLDWMDFHFVRWRRWELDARHRPLAAIEPSSWQDSRELLSFLSSSWGDPDPGCPSCRGTGARWLAQFDLLRLRRGPLAGVPMLLLFGDSDPELPIDLEARASAPPERLAALPQPAGTQPGDERGPFATERPRPFDDLRYLEDAPSTLANAEAAEAALGWIQHLVGYGDPPRLRVEEAIVGGDVEVTVAATEGNATVTGVGIRVLAIGELDASDFKAALHREHPVPLAWRRVDPLYAGHDRSAPGAHPTSRWKGYFPVDRARNQAYYVVVHTRAGSRESAHSLPIRALWHLGDPARGPVRL